MYAASGLLPIKANLGRPRDAKLRDLRARSAGLPKRDSDGA